MDVEQRSARSPSLDFKPLLSSQFAETGAFDSLKPGGRVAVAVGSRGIRNLKTIVATVVELLRARGAQPYVVPAMGSHGEATSEGQAAVLAEYGITQELLSIPFDTRMDAESIGATENGIEVFFSKAALEGDGIVVINRVKPHTDFDGSIGSGILKMMAIGLGKFEGARTCHAAASRLGHEAVIRAVARVVINKAPILCGVAILEDQNHETVDIKVLMPPSLAEQEEKLFRKAQSLMPHLPFDEIDLLVVDFIGKELSGAGMDPNVIGRPVQGYSASLRLKEGSTPRIGRIFVRQLTEATNGNATGIGLADFTTTRAVERINLAATYTNALTALVPLVAKIPIYFDSDAEVLDRAIASLALPDTKLARIVRVASTLSLHKFQASEAYQDQIRARSDLVVTRAAHDMEFDHRGDLLPL
jgi:nucleotide-binding universal stress UspA family protein